MSVPMVETMDTSIHCRRRRNPNCLLMATVAMNDETDVIGTRHQQHYRHCHCHHHNHPMVGDWRAKVTTWCLSRRRSRRRSGTRPRDGHDIPRRPRPSPRLRLFLRLVLCLAGGRLGTRSGPPPSALVGALEATWTPANEETADGRAHVGGPLPLSSQRREQLLQLEQVILSSSDPAATLQHAAAAQQLDAADLWSILQQNRRELERAGVSIPPLPTPAAVARPTQHFLAKIPLVLWHTAQRHPRRTALGLAGLALTAHVVRARPRSGLVLSTQRSTVSRGPTTLWSPPATYIQQRLLLLPRQELDDDDHDGESVIVGSSRHTLDRVRRLETLARELGVFEDSPAVEGTNNSPDFTNRDSTTLTHWFTRAQLPSEVRAAAVAQTVVRLDQVLGLSTPANDEEDRKDRIGALVVVDDDGTDDEQEDMHDNEEEEEEIKSHLLDICLGQASTVLSSRRFTEWVQPDGALRYVPSDDEHSDGMLVVQGMGDFQRYGLLPLRVDREPDHIEELKQQKQVQLVLGTFRGHGHWDGFIAMTIRPTQSPVVGFVIQVQLVVPSGGNSLPRALAQTIVQQLSASIALSITRRVQQSLARQSQSSRFAGLFRQKAQHRRHGRHDKEKALEEMATERRRRWQRQHPNVGHYRPSGDRMRSPKNC